MVAAAGPLERADICLRTNDLVPEPSKTTMSPRHRAQERPVAIRPKRPQTRLCPFTPRKGALSALSLSPLSAEDANSRTNRVWKAQREECGGCKVSWVNLCSRGDFADHKTNIETRENDIPQSSTNGSKTMFVSPTLMLKISIMCIPQEACCLGLYFFFGPKSIL